MNYSKKRKKKLNQLNEKVFCAVYRLFTYLNLISLLLIVMSIDTANLKICIPIGFLNSAWVAYVLYLGGWFDFENSNNIKENTHYEKV